MNEARADVVILGGGLAGLTLALQLRQQHADIDVRVIERNAHPVREGAFKVGESTVEMGAHYFANVLGLKEHLEREHIRKFGFRFFFSEGSHDIAGCTELGVSRLMPTPSWQIDRGRFENFLGQRARAAGVTFLDGAVVKGVDLATDGSAHAVRYERDGSPARMQARWVVDASGRAGLLKRALGLAQDNDHDVNAVWWRVEGQIDPNAWSADPAWLQRCTPPDRWRSTNHMCGPGYWFWLIPLSSGAHSLGIVCDAKLHPLETMNTHARAMEWLRTHQPQVAASLDPQRHPVQDFRFLRHFSYGCRQVFSADRWALTGEAGVFLDPFYSPGSDFIAIANTYICELVQRDRAGAPVGPYANLYEQLYMSFYDSTLTLYRHQYPLFGDAQVMPVKVIWDYTYYWALLAPLYISGRIADLGMLGRLRAQLLHGQALNAAVQPLLRAWSAGNVLPQSPDGRLLDQYNVGWFHDMNRALHDVLDDDAFAARLEANVARMRWLAGEILARARQQQPATDDFGLHALLGGHDASATLLDPAWYAHAA